MNLTQLPAITEKRKKRLGQGHGSGRVKTSGRGTKGQKARNKVPLVSEGGALPLTKRLPFLRGKAKNKSLQMKKVILNVGQLNSLPKNSTVSIDSLAKHKLVDAKEAGLYGVKILGNGELTTPLKVTLSVSKSARDKITKAGGTVEVVS